MEISKNQASMLHNEPVCPLYDELKNFNNEEIELIIDYDDAFGFIQWENV